MSRAYHHKRQHYSKSDDQVGFIVTVLLAGTLWTHRAMLIKVEHVAMIAALVMVGLVVVTFFFRLIRRARTGSVGHPNMTAIDVMTGLEFEHYVARLLKQQGYTDVRLTEKYDLGVDIIATKGGVTWGIQVKRYSGLVGVEAIRQVVTALRKYRCDRAMVITNSTYSRAAVDLAESNDCVLIERRELMKRYM